MGPANHIGLKERNEVYKENLEVGVPGAWLVIAGLQILRPSRHPKTVVQTESPRDTYDERLSPTDSRKKRLSLD